LAKYTLLLLYNYSVAAAHNVTDGRLTP